MIVLVKGIMHWQGAEVKGSMVRALMDATQESSWWQSLPTFSTKFQGLDFSQATTELEMPFLKEGTNLALQTLLT